MKYLHLFRHPSLWSRLLVAAALACALPACVKPEEVNYVQNLVLDQQQESHARADVQQGQRQRFQPQG